MFIYNRIKADNDVIYTNVDAIHSAIHENMKVSFKYCEWTPDLKLVWRCVSRLIHHKLGTDCPSRTIYEKDLHAAVVEAVNQLIGQKAAFLPAFKANVEKIVGCSNSVEIAALDEKMLGIQKELLKKAGAKQDYADLTDQIDAIREEKQQLLLEDAEKEGVRQQMKVIEEFLDGQQEKVEEYDEALVRKLIEKITVYDDHLAFEFKSGLETEVQM